DDRLVGLGRGRPGWAAYLQAVEQRRKPLAVLGEIDRLRRGSEDPVARGLEGPGQLERGLAAELRDDAGGALPLADRQDLLDAERLEVEPVGGVVVRRDGLPGAVDHHRPLAALPDRLGPPDPAVV